MNIVQELHTYGYHGDFYEVNIFEQCYSNNTDDLDDEYYCVSNNFDDCFHSCKQFSLPNIHHYYHNKPILGSQD